MKNSKALLNKSRTLLEHVALQPGSQGDAARRALQVLNSSRPHAARPHAASSALASPRLAAQVHSLDREVRVLERKLEASARREFLATRPDLSKELLKVLASEPLPEVKRIVNAIPTPDQKRATEQAQAEASKMDRRMGLASREFGVRRVETAERGLVSASFGLLH